MATNDREYHARLVVYDLPKLKKKDLKRLVSWLRLTADDIELSPKEYVETFTTRLMK